MTAGDLARAIAEATEYGEPRAPVVDKAPAGNLASEIEPEKVTWLWYGYVPNKLTVLNGIPGQGKSTLTLDLAARVSRGNVMPDGSPGGDPGAVIIVNLEDGAADTTVPRLIAADADLSRILILSTVGKGKAERPFMLPDDLPVIQEAIEWLSEKTGLRVQLIIVDPLMAALNTEVNSWKDQSIRQVLTPVGILAEEASVAFVIVVHPPKNAGGNSVYYSGGSVGIVGAARSSLLAAPDPQDEDRHVLAWSKGNLAPKPDSLTYRIEQAGNGMGRIVWEGVSEHGVDALINQGGTEERSELEEAKEVLLSILSEGPVTAKDVKRQYQEADISEMTAKRAKKALKIKSHRPSIPGPWIWELPPSGSNNPQEDQGDQYINDDPLGNIDPLGMVELTGFEPSNPLSCLHDSEHAWRPIGSEVWKCSVCHPPASATGLEWFGTASLLTQTNSPSSAI